MLLVTRLCLFAGCSCHRGFAGACSDMFVFICMLRLPSGLGRCLFMTRLPCGRVNDTFTLLNMLLLPTGFACVSYILVWHASPTTGAL